MTTDRSPPHDRAAERAVLGSCIRHNPAIADVAQVLAVADFYHDAHQRIYRAIMAIHADGARVDLVSLADALREQIADLGGYAYLADLWESEPTGANAEYYAGIVRDHAIARSIIHLGTEMVREGYQPTGAPVEALEGIERRIFAIAEQGIRGEAVSLADSVGDAYDRLDARSNRRGEPDVPVTGLLDLDAMLAGLHPSELVIVGARPGIGKTAFAVFLARHVAVSQSLPVFFVSLEQSRAELVDRIICCEAGIDGQKFRKGMLTADERAAVSAAGSRFRESATLLIDDTTNQSMLRIGSTARRHLARSGIRLIVVDYLQLIDPDNRRDPRHEQVSTISRRLKLLARELRLPVVALAQVNRGPEDRVDRRPRLSDLRESGGIEADADTVLLLHHPPQELGILEIDVAKQRNGPRGVVKVVFQSWCMRFLDCADAYSLR